MCLRKYNVFTYRGGGGESKGDREREGGRERERENERDREREGERGRVRERERGREGGRERERGRAHLNSDDETDGDEVVVEDDEREDGVEEIGSHFPCTICSVSVCECVRV